MLFKKIQLFLIIYSCKIFYYFGSTLPKDALCQFDWNWPSGSGEDVEKGIKFTDRPTDDRQIVIRKVHLSSPLRWANDMHKK